MRSVQDLIEARKRGETFEFLFFWGHRKPTTSETTKSCFSQWYEAAFDRDGVTYPTAEHFMMAKKAELFGDVEARDAILAATDPGKAKALGRKVKGFDEATWREHRWSIVVEANVLKFGGTPRLKKFLLATGDAVLVEASPFDFIWGIGLAADTPDANEPERWKGLNLLGFALMESRARLAALELECDAP